MKPTNVKNGLKYDDLKKQYAILKGQGMLQRDIAKKLNVSVGTVSDWAKTLPISLYLEIRKGLQKRLLAASKDENTPILDLYNLQNTLAGVEKQINLYTSGKMHL